MTPRVRPVERIELSEKHIKARIICVVLFLALGVVCIAFGVKSCVGITSGWRGIEVNSSVSKSALSDAGELNLVYNIGYAKMSATREYKAVTKCYSEAIAYASDLFNADTEHGINLAWFNSHPNEWGEVDQRLYDALKLLSDNKNRTIFLAPLYPLYSNLLFSETTSDMEEFDPKVNAEAALFCQQVAAYANNENHISFAFEDGKVKLVISADYLAFASENDIDGFVDLWWMKNAFLIDVIAERLTEEGFVAGYLTSVDGFNRNLCPNETEYSLDLYEKGENTVYPVGTLLYSNEMSVVRLKAYPLSGDPEWISMLGSDGEVRHVFIDPSDGIYRTSISDLVGFSRTKGCSEIVAAMGPLFTTTSFDKTEINGLTESGIGAVYCDGTNVILTDSSVTITDLLSSTVRSYTLKEINPKK